MRDDSNIPLFALGRIVATPAAIEAAGAQASDFIELHVRGSWEESPEEDRLSNHRAVLNGNERILSVHTTERRQVIWIITEADRSTTTLLLPSEY